MTSYPKHYLADVPQELRLRLLDLCIHRQWHDAIDLLHQNGFTQYEWYEVVWFHDHAPTNLPPLECGGSTPLSISDSEISNVKSQIPQPHGVPPETSRSDRGSGGLATPESSIQEPASEPGSLTADNLNDPTLTPLRELRASVVKFSKPRSKIARLPSDIQDNLNTLLADGRPYADIIRFLNDRGYPGFNKVNLHNWRKTGFCTHDRARCSDTVQKISEAVQKPVEGDRRS